MSSYINKYWEVWGQNDALYESWAASQNVNSKQLFVLYALDQRDSVTQKMIADYTGLPKQTVNTVIRNLKAEGYVTLSTERSDHREKLVVFTEKGKIYSKNLLTPLYELEHRVFDIMGEERVKQMVDAILLFNTVFEREMKRRTR